MKVYYSEKASSIVPFFPLVRKVGRHVRFRFKTEEWKKFMNE